MPDPAPLPAPEAQDRILHDLAPLPEVWLALEDALGFGLTSDVPARRTQPPWDNSAMDGYAVRSADAARAPVTLRVVGVVHAGDQPTRSVGPGEAVRIMTGAPMPPGADAVVMQERTRAVAGRGSRRGRGPGGGGGAPERARRRRGRARRRGAAPGRDGARHPRAGAARRTGDRPRCAFRGVRGWPSSRPATSSAGRTRSPRGASWTPTRSRSRWTSDAPAASRTCSASPATASRTSSGSSAPALDYDVRAHLRRRVGRRARPRATRARAARRGEWTSGAWPSGPASRWPSGGEARRGSSRSPATPPRPSSPSSSSSGRRSSGSIGRPDPLPRPVQARSGVDLKKNKGLAHYVRVVLSWREGEPWADPLPTQTSGAVRSAVSATHLLHFPMDSMSVRRGDPVQLLPVGWGP